MARPIVRGGGRLNHSGRPQRARKSLVPSTYRVGVPRDGSPGTSSLVPPREATRTRYCRQASLARRFLPDSLQKKLLYLRRGLVSATLTIFKTRHIRHALHSYPSREVKVR
jgi:hypothetical protein